MTERKEPVVQQIASLLQAVANCIESGNHEWEIRHEERIEKLVDRYLPSGSGFDSGVKLTEDAKPDRLVFQADYHHMDDNGMYDGWGYYQVIVTPSLAHGFNVRVTGRNRNDIKDYIAEVFQHGLSTVAEVA